jgi:hypothetical protein
MLTIDLQNPNVKTAIFVEINGNTRSNLAVQQEQGKITVELPSDVRYVALAAP